ncbi:MAG TPA: RNA polymerase sigma factor SigJ, partial [Devosia sp.]|nr:RNA polymerase sigma factor SigJ [Devosia sp.]
RAAVEVPEAYLVRVVTRLCLDALKSARRRRETYVGPWLPEPVVEADDAADGDVTLPLLLALERLSPLERAAFLLHDVFGMPFEEVAGAIGRDAAATRQLATRARRHVHEDRPRFDLDRQHGLALAEAFHAASLGGDLAELRAMLAEDVVLTSDGGGKRPAGQVPLSGRETVVAFLHKLAEVFHVRPGEVLRYARINGLPGYVTLEADGVLQTTALDIRDGRIAAIYVMRNPDKLRHLEASLH